LAGQKKGLTDNEGVGRGLIMEGGGSSRLTTKLGKPKKNGSSA